MDAITKTSNTRANSRTRTFPPPHEADTTSNIQLNGRIGEPNSEIVTTINAIQHATCFFPSPKVLLLPSEGTSGIGVAVMVGAVRVRGPVTPVDVGLGSSPVKLGEGVSVDRDSVFRDSVRSMEEVDGEEKLLPKRGLIVRVIIGLAGITPS